MHFLQLQFAPDARVISVVKDFASNTKASLKIDAQIRAYKSSILEFCSRRPAVDC